MVLPGKLGGRVGRRRDSSRSAAHRGGASSFPGPDVRARSGSGTMRPMEDNHPQPDRPQRPARPQARGASSRNRRDPAAVASQVIPPGPVARPTGAAARQGPVVPARAGSLGRGTADPLPPRADPVRAIGGPLPAIGGLLPPPRGGTNGPLRRGPGWRRSCPRRR